MVRKSITQRNAAQRERQQRLRKIAKLERKPSRDDIARVLLHWLLNRAAKTGHMAEVDRIADKIVARLVAQGFDERKSYEVFDDILERYTKRRWEFRRKIHLTPPITSSNDVCD
jgi:hypothetical protein